MLRKNIRTLLITLIIATFIIVPRLPNLGQYVTADEPAFFSEAASFYYALANGNFSDTLRYAHPAITSMWAGVGSFLLHFPEYKDLGQVGMADLHLRELLGEYNLGLLQLLVTGRAFIILGHAALLVLAYWLMQRLFDTRLAILGLIFISLDPFFFGLSRLFQHDAILANLSLAALLAYFNYQRAGQRKDLLLSGALCGLALLTKTPAIIVIGTIGLLALWDAIRQKTLNKTSRDLLLWGAVLLGVFMLLWPAMWTAPVNTLEKVVSYTLDSSSGAFTSRSFFNGQIFTDGQLGFDALEFYPVTVLWRATPAMLIGLLLAVGFSFVAGEWNVVRQYRREWLAFGLFITLFTLALTLATKKFDRYLIPVYLPLDLLAAAGWLTLAGWLRQRGRQRELRAEPWYLGSIVLLVAVVLHTFPVVETAPYYLSYYNPLLGGSAKAPEVLTIGWGEGLDQAAHYLNQDPKIHQKTVYAWYSQAFDYHFNGVSQHFPIDDRSLSDNWLAEILDGDYIVIYIHQWQRQAPARLLAILAEQTPEHTIWINGLEYARIYNLREH